MKQNNERIHVCYALSDPYGTYAKFPGTSLCSLFENTASPVSAHILHDDTLTPENRERFLRLGERYGQEILFYHVTELAKETWGRAMALFPEGLSSRRYTSANMYRLLLPALLPPEVDKAIYLDGDTVVHMDVAELWGESVDSGLAAVSDLELLHHYGKEGRESEDASYLYRGGSARLETVFNAGVLVFRLDRLRKGDNLLLSGVRFLSEHRDCKYYDNDILIAFFGESYTHLPWYCNIRLNWDMEYGSPALTKGIYHYLGRNYRMDSQDPRHALFLSYYRKSPWCDERTLVKACRLAQDIAVAKTRERLREVQRIYRLCFRKQRVFVGLAEDEARLRRDFFLHGGEYYLPLAPGDTLRLPYSVDTHVYLFFWADYGAIRALMEKAGYEEYVHFADGRTLMPEQTEGLRSGDIIRSKSLETALYNINELHGIQAAGILSPGETEGTSDLTIRLNPGKSATATLYTENYGSKSSGRYRYGLQASLLGVGTTGGRLTAGTLISNNSLHNYNVGWDMPVGHSGTNLGIRFSRMDYELGSMFSQLGAEGIANTLSLYGTTPLWRTARNTALLTYGYDYRKLTDRYRLFGISMKKHSHVFHAGLDGMLRNGTTSALHYNFTVYRGTLSADSDWAETMGQAADTLGGFTKGVMDLTGVQSVGGPFDVLLKFQGQLASRNLDGSERIYLGGAQGVRAYPQGEGSGDQGCLGTVELRYHTPVQGLTLSTYFDAGHVSRSKDGTAGNDTLKGWGIGVTYQHPDNYFARLDYARRIGAPEIMSNDAKSKQRMWFMMGKTW